MEIIKMMDVKTGDLASGKIFIYPTDTVYGVGCNALLEKSVERIRRLKGTQHPFSVIAPSKDWIRENFILRHPEYLKKLPGPYTLILEMKNKIVPENVSKKTLGVRIPDHPFTRLVQKAGVPFITTSANVSGKKTIERVSELPLDIVAGVDVAIDGGIIKGKPSTIIDLTKGIRVLR